MHIHTINSYTQSNIIKKISFKERDIVDDYVKTPYEQEMDALDKETDNLLDLMKYLYKDSPMSMKRAIDDVYKRALEKRKVIETKYLKPKSFIQKLFKH